MCQKATQTAATLMAAIEPTLKQLLALEGLASSPDGIAAITAFDAAQAALAAWVPGTTAATVVEALNAFSQVFAVLPLPETAKALEAIISAGIVTVIGIVTANSPAPAPAPITPAAEPAETASPDVQARAQDLYAHAVSAETEAQVAAMTGYKPSFITKAKVVLGDHGAVAGQYKGMWNKAVGETAKTDPKYAVLKQG